MSARILNDKLFTHIKGGGGGGATEMRKGFLQLRLL